METGYEAMKTNTISPSLENSNGRRKKEKKRT
jgi:hypothetical protein